MERERHSSGLAALATLSPAAAAKKKVEDTMFNKRPMCDRHQDSPDYGMQNAGMVGVYI